VLGVPRTYGLDLAEAERRFREASRRFHPDRFAKADPRARRASLQRTVQLNEAWKTLRDPVRRAEYLLRLAGTDIGGEEGASRRPLAGAGAAARTATDTGTAAAARELIPVPAALLGEILELREALAEARDTDDDRRVQNMANDVRSRLNAALARVAATLTRAEQSPAESVEALGVAAGELMAIRYFRRFLDEVSVHDEGVASGGEEARHA